MAAPGSASGDHVVSYLWAVDECDGGVGDACKADDNRNAEEFLNLRSFYTISSWYRRALPPIVPLLGVFVDPLRYMSPLLLSLPPPVLA